jgi:hypothetical protein
MTPFRSSWNESERSAKATGHSTSNSGSGKDRRQFSLPRGKWWSKRTGSKIVSPNFHFSELLRIFNDNGVRYLVVGGYAVMLWSEPRFTKDLDVWVGDDDDNAARVFRALAEFGAPLSGVRPADFAKPDLICQLGVPPLRVDVLTSYYGSRV